ncbi:MAG: hypothetical protein LAN62_13530 [Acidobacteriia bacterium]|nr:hypothetical protein [Terriglobia bacterium]
MIKLSAKGLAEFMTQSPAAQTRTLRNFKLKAAEGAIRVKYYAEARGAVRQYHLKNNDRGVLETAIHHLETKAGQASGRGIGRLANNIRAIRSYYRNFGDTRFRILPTPRIHITQGDVTISAIPDLCAQEGRSPKLIKLELGTRIPDERAVDIVLHVMFQAARMSGHAVRRQDVIILDVEHGTRYTGANVGVGIERDIEAACHAIEDMWPAIK